MRNLGAVLGKAPGSAPLSALLRLRSELGAEPEPKIEKWRAESQSGAGKWKRRELGARAEPEIYCAGAWLPVFSIRNKSIAALIEES